MRVLNRERATKVKANGSISYYCCTATNVVNETILNDFNLCSFPIGYMPLTIFKMTWLSYLKSSWWPNHRLYFVNYFFWRFWCQLLKSQQKKMWKKGAFSKLSAYFQNYMHRTEWWWVLKRKYTYFIALLFAFLFVFESTLFEQLTFTHYYCLSTHKQTFNFV